MKDHNATDPSRRHLLALAAGTAAGLTSVPAFAQNPSLIPLATWGGTNHVCIREFVPALEKALTQLGPHNLKFQHFPGGQLGQDKDMPMSIPTGQVKFAWVTVNGWTGVVPDAKVMDAPSGLTMAELEALIERPNGLGSTLKKRFSEKNTALLAFADLGPPAIVSKTPILSPADLKGKKVRVFSEGQVEAIRLMGGAPVNMAFAEVYTGMQHGTIDAAIIGFQGVDSQKMHEVAKHVTVAASFLGTTMMGWAANPQWLNALQPNDRRVFQEAVRKAEMDTRKAIVGEIDQLTKSYQQRGMTVTFLDPKMKEYPLWRDATRPLLDSAIAKLSPDVGSLLVKK